MTPCAVLLRMVRSFCRAGGNDCDADTLSPLQRLLLGIVFGLFMFVVTLLSGVVELLPTIGQFLLSLLGEPSSLPLTAATTQSSFCPVARSSLPLSCLTHSLRASSRPAIWTSTAGSWVARVYSTGAAGSCYGAVDRFSGWRARLRDSVVEHVPRQHGLLSRSLRVRYGCAMLVHTLSSSPPRALFLSRPPAGALVAVIGIPPPIAYGLSGSASPHLLLELSS